MFLMLTYVLFFASEYNLLKLVDLKNKIIFCFKVDLLCFKLVFVKNVQHVKKNSAASGAVRTKNFYSGGDALTYYRMNSAMDITWSHRTNSRDDLEAKLNGYFVIIVNLSSTC